MQVTLVFADGQEARIAVDAETSVLDAAKASGFALKCDCTLGLCGSCKAICRSGTFVLDYSDGLTIMERRRSYVLTCVMHPTSDCRLELPYRLAEITAQLQCGVTGTVSRIERVSTEVCRLVVDAPDAAALRFEPGQYVSIGVPGTGAARSYSFANPPGTAQIEFFVRLIPGGVMSEYLRSEVTPGARIELSAPNGVFRLRDLRGPVLMIAGGTGLAPMLSMLSCIVREGRPHGPVRLLFGVNRFEDLFCLERLKEYRSRMHDFSYEIAIRDHDERWSGNNGYVTELLKAADLHGGDIDVYICGPPAMSEDACARLSRHGVTDERIFVEKFAATGSTRAP